VLLTGATGFLCGHVLGELLATSDAHVICLVRAASEALGRERLRATLEQYGLDTANFEARVEVVIGDLAEPLLGLSASDFAALADRLDSSSSIIHGGAWVDFIQPYARLEAVNVRGTHEVIRLAVHAGNVPLNLVSTIGVFDTLDQTGEQRVLEGDQPGRDAGFRNGYGHTKWAAEQLLNQARARGLPVRVFRPGIVCGSTATGAWQGDMVAALLKSFVESGLAIEPRADRSLDAAPVDYVVRAMLQIAGQPQTMGGTFHLNNPRPTPWHAVYAAIATLGHPLQLVPYAEWLEALTGPHADPALLPYAAYFKARDQAWKLRQPSFDCSETHAALAGSGIECPVLDQELLALYFAHFRRTGFFAPAPASECDDAR
jgi:thioester reductase-like protein